MTENLIDQLINEIIEALDEQPRDLDRLEALLQDVKDMMATSLFHEVPLDEQDSLKTARRDLETAINALRQGTSESSSEDEWESPGESLHDPEAERLMDQAETAFYGGGYRNAISLYEKVLAIEPGWERARANKAQAEEYLRNGHLPAEALPEEAAILFGKARSAMRVMNYKRASDLWQEAKTILAEAGIAKFEEGRKFEEKLNDDLEAQQTYQDGLEELRQGKWEEALNKVQLAADLAGLPLYKEKVDKLRRNWNKVKRIRQILVARPLIADLVLDALDELDALEAEYSGNPEIERLREQSNTAREILLNQLIDRVDARLGNISNARCIRDAEMELDLVEQQIRILHGLDSGKWAHKLIRIEAIKRHIKEELSLDCQRLVRVSGALEQKRYSDDVKEDFSYLQAMYPRCREIIELGQHLKFHREHEPRLESSINTSGKQSQDPLLRRLTELIDKDPTNSDLLLRYEWARIQSRISTRQSLFQDDRVANVRMLQSQSRFWFLASVVTGVLLLGMALVLIWLTFDQENVWSSAISLVSLLPALASGLIYRQALDAHARADDLYEKIRADNQQDMAIERKIFDDIRQRLFDVSKFIS